MAIDDTDTEVTTAPWDSDLETAFEDEDVRQRVSDFLGSKVQPYVTKVEQDSKPNRDATRLWKGFEESPVDTSVAVVKELYGDDIADQFASLLQGGASVEDAAKKVEDDTQVDVTDTSAVADGKVKFEDLPPQVQNAVAAQEQDTQRKAYYNEIDRVKTENADKLPKDAEDNPQLDVDLFHPFVVAANGDFDEAAQAYFKWIDQAKSQFGIKVPTTDDIPVVVNSETKDSSAKPPTEETFDSLDDAMDSFFKDQQTPPPTVGTA